MVLSVLELNSVVLELQRADVRAPSAPGVPVFQANSTNSRQCSAGEGSEGKQHSPQPPASQRLLRCLLCVSAEAEEQLFIQGLKGETLNHVQARMLLWHLGSAPQAEGSSHKL